MGCLWERRYGTDRTSPPRQKRIPIPTGQKNRKTEQEGPSSHPVTVAMETVPPSPTERQEKKEKTIRKTTKTPKSGAQKTSSEANP
ncbi:MAG: hypothetical protein ACLR8S_13305 [Paraprevotella clara]